MDKTFRIAIGNCSCRNPNLKQSRDLQQICRYLLENLDKVKKLTLQQIEAMPDEVSEIIRVGNSEIEVTTVKEVRESGYLIVISAFLPTWKWPTYFSLTGIGNLVAEGVLVSNEGMVEDAPEEEMWAYR